MHMTFEEPTRLERKLAKDLKREAHGEEVALHHHLKMIEKADKHRKEADLLRKELAKLQVKQIRLQERIEEHELKARELEELPPELRHRV